MLKRVLMKIFWGFEEGRTYSIAEVLLVNLRRAIALGVLVFMLGSPFLGISTALQFSAFSTLLTFAGGLELLE